MIPLPVGSESGKAGFNSKESRRGIKRGDRRLDDTRIVPVSFHWETKPRRSVAMLKRWQKQTDLHPIHSQGERFSQDQLHERD